MDTRTIAVRRRLPADVPLFLRAVAYAGAVRLALWVVPSARLLGYVRGRVEAAKPLPGAPDVDRLAWAARAAGRRVPRATCLVQALCAQLLLARHGHDSVLRIGVNRDPDGEFRAHAWVEVGGRIVVGARPGRWYHLLPDLEPALRAHLVR